MSSISLQSGRSYSLKDVNRVHESRFGPDATEIMMARIYREVGKES